MKKMDKKEIELLERENTPDNVIRHCKAVYKKAMEIAANFDNVNEDIIISEGQKLMASPMPLRELKLPENTVIPPRF